MCGLRDLSCWNDLSGASFQLFEVEFHIDVDGIGVSDGFECGALEVPDSAAVAVG